MIRRTIVTVVLALGMVASTASVASAAEQNVLFCLLKGNSVKYCFGYHPPTP